MTRDGILKLALDLKRGMKVFEVNDKTYSAPEATEVLRAALIEANGGSAKFDRKALRRNKVEIFEIIETLVNVIVNEGFKGDEFWTRFVDERNLALGDKNEFVVPENSEFVVSKIADGILTPRRQRIGKQTTLSVDTEYRIIRAYEEFSRFMSGRIDWVDVCDRVAKAFQKAMWTDIYTAFTGINETTAPLNGTYIVNGAYDEDALLEICEHVEATTGKTVYICGAASALRKCTTAVVSHKAQDALYDNGYYGKFNGYDMIKLNQVHAPGTDRFILPSNELYIVAGDDQFIKFVREGDTEIIERDYSQNADATQEYLMREKWGVAVVFSGKGFGKYTIAA